MIMEEDSGWCVGHDPYREEEEEGGGVNVIKVPVEGRFGGCRNEQRMVLLSTAGPRLVHR